MRIGIDGSNLRSGGAITHLSELLKAADPERDKFCNVIVWGEQALLNQIEDRIWLVKHHELLLDKSLLHRLYWQKTKSSELARKENCDVLFIPSGIVLGDFKPVVTMSHNMLPFSSKEISRYGFSWQLIRNYLLRFIMSSSYRRAQGVIFLTQFSKENILKVIGKLKNIQTVIPHGVNEEFRNNLKTQLKISDYHFSNPFRILYVSTVDMYKHQWNVAIAVANLRRKNVPVELHLVGSAYPKARKKLAKTLKQIDIHGEFIHYRGPVKYSELPELHRQSDLIVFASSCENMPNILLEGMASGLPIACSLSGPMPEVLGLNSGLYFNPESIAEIECAIWEFVQSPDKREQMARTSLNRSKQFSWKQCSGETFGFLVKIAKAHSKGVK